MAGSIRAVRATSDPQFSWISPATLMGSSSRNRSWEPIPALLISRSMVVPGGLEVVGEGVGGVRP